MQTEPEKHLVSVVAVSASIASLEFAAYLVYVLILIAAFVLGLIFIFYVPNNPAISRLASISFGLFIVLATGNYLRGALKMPLKTTLESNKIFTSSLSGKRQFNLDTISGMKRVQTLATTHTIDTICLISNSDEKLYIQLGVMKNGDRLKFYEPLKKYFEKIEDSTLEEKQLKNLNDAKNLWNWWFRFLKNK